MRHMPLLPRLALYFSAFVLIATCSVAAFKHPAQFLTGAAIGALMAAR